MNHRAKQRIQAFVIATSFPPLKQFYIGIYWLVIWLVTWRAARHPAVVAVYLKRGCARGEIVPGLSDIDMAAFVEGHVEKVLDLEPSARREYSSNRMDIMGMGWYRSYVEYFPMLEGSLEVREWSEFKVGADNHTREKLRLAEVKATWRLLYGKDLLAELSVPKREEINVGLYVELQRWWQMFVQWVPSFQDGSLPGYTRNSLCFRVCCEIIRWSRIIRGEALDFWRSRKDILIGSKASLEAGEQPFVDKLEWLNAKRFRPTDTAFADEAKDFLLTYGDRFFGEISLLPWAQPSTEYPQQIDYPADEGFDGEAMQPHLDGLISHLETQWGSAFCGAYLTPAFVAHLDGLLLLIQVNPQLLPTLGQLAQLQQRYFTIEEELKRPLDLYLLLPNTGYYIGRRRTIGYWGPILTQDVAFDVFALLNQSVSILRPGGFRTTPTAVSPSLIGAFVHERKLRNYKYLMEGPLEELDDLGFLRIFWKYLQMLVMAHGLERGGLVSALTLAAVERGLAAAGLGLPTRLKGTAASYGQLLEGQKVDLSLEKAAALAYIRRIDPAGKRFSTLLN